MEESLSDRLRTLFLIHALVGFVFGAPLWLVPGRTLTLLGWVPEMVALPETEMSVPGVTFINPVFVRLLGAALLALALSSFLAWRARRWEEVNLLVQLELAFTVLGAVAIVVGAFTLDRDLPAIGWVTLAIYVIFAVAWGAAWLRRPGR